MTPKLTAIVSAYYCEPYLEKRLTNLLEQGLGNALEVIVVCQKDSPEQKIAVPYVNKFDYFVVKDTDDVPTVYDAWNMGVALALGQYLTNANGDDWHYPGALKRMMDELDGHPGSAVVYADVDRTDEHMGEAKGQFNWLEGGLAELYWKGCFIGPMPMWRAELHKKHGLFDPEMRSAGDYEFWMRLAAGGEKFHHIRGFVSGGHLERLDALEHREPVRSIWEQSRSRGKFRHIIDVPK